MTPNIQQLTLHSGRTLDYQTTGSPHGYPLVFIHGTPGSLLPVTTLIPACTKLNVKLVTMSRAGYGGSTRDKGRKVVDAVADIEELLRHLGVEECVVGGWSGGGPVALACAARLKKCKAALCIAGVAPYVDESGKLVRGLDWLEGQGEDNIEETKAALQGEPTMAEFAAAQRPEMLGLTVEKLVEAWSTILPNVDKKAMVEHRELGSHLVETINEGLKHSADGWVDDSMATIAPWRFELDEIKVPVLLYQGSEDAMVPFGHGKWLAEHLPKEGLRAELIEGEGHISIFIGREVEMVRDLLRMAGKGGA